MVIVEGTIINIKTYLNNYINKLKYDSFLSSRNGVEKSEFEKKLTLT